MDKLKLLKSLAPGFLPLIVFIVADSVWGTRVGLMVAVVFGIIEFFFSYFREKVIDKFILLDIALIVLLGAVSILLENEIFFKLKPAIIELIFCVILGISIFSPVNIIMLISKRYMKNIELNPTVQAQFNRSLKLVFVLFLFHTILIIYSAFFMSKQAWAFISGGLFYLIFLLVFLFESLRNRFGKTDWNREYPDEEWFDIVDVEGKIVGKAPRSICHSKPGMLHPVVHIHVLDNRDRFYLQKRSSKKLIQPSKWDTAIGGHILSGEKLEDALKREANEELGLKEFQLHFVSRYIWETDIESELVFMFFTRCDQIPVPNPDEIDEGRFWKIKKIRDNLGKGIFTPNFEHEFGLLLDKVFKITE
jgi:isopentenyldiphosphate isomerase/intracellular septation protein A